ncbi:MAG: lysophospholipid acyltransferase family protein [Nitrospirota bacterium]
MKKAVWLAEAILYLILSLPIAVLPRSLALRAGEMLGLFFFYFWKSRREVALDNLEKSVASRGIRISVPAQTIIKENFRNLGRSLAEVIKIYYGLGGKIIESVRMKGAENFEIAKSKGRGILFISGHCGNWELLAVTASAKLPGTAVIARPINNPYVNRLVETLRKKYGNRVIYKKGALKPVIQTLKSNRGVGILMDQAVMKDEGYVIDFLGRGAWTSKVPAMIARKTGAAVLPVFIHRTDKGHEMEIYQEIALSRNGDRELAVREDTIAFSRCIEQYIQKHPAEWLWIHRRWKRVRH